VLGGGYIVDLQRFLKYIKCIILGFTLYTALFQPLLTRFLE
jgi:hypothetical protein